MFRAGDFSFPLGVRTYIMGILNYTPDSFSDGGLFNTPEKALEHALLMEKQGADIIDLGANSTRPGAEILSSEDEMKRLSEVMDILPGKLSTPLSVDTFYPECAEYALSKGALIINDVSGKFNPDIAGLVKKYKGAYIVTHNPAGADGTVKYENGVTAAVREYFLGVMSQAADAGLSRSSLCLDPGFGFGKTREENYDIAASMNWLKFGGTALLAGASRKRMTDIGGSFSEEEKDLATAAIHTLCIQGGADIIRVHNVPAAKSAAAAADAVCRKVR